MTLSNLLTPWLMLAGVLILLHVAEKWVHRHLFGVGWVLTNNKKTATALYYVLLLPGVFVHEFTQYLVAGALNVRIRRVIAWPEAQDNGTLRLNFITLQRARPLERAIVGAAPLATGLALVWVISTQILNLEDVLAALLQSDLPRLTSALRVLAGTPDFYLWLYLMFAIGNAMLPTPADREGWPLILAIFGGIVAFLVVIGVGEVLLQTFTGPVAHAVELLATAFLTVLIVQIPAIIAIAILEGLAIRLTGRRFEYKPQPTRTRSRQPGSAEPLPPGAPLPSIYNLQLPLPDPVRDAGPAPRRQPGQPEGAPAPRPATARPATPSPFEQARRAAASEASPSPGPTPEQSPRPATPAAFRDSGSEPVRPKAPAAPLPGSSPSVRPAAPPASFAGTSGPGRTASDTGFRPIGQNRPQARQPFLPRDNASGEGDSLEDELVYEDFDDEDGVLDDIYDDA
ncbi:MAG: hypothetical protein Kow00106_18240 [Anaerolineae bacterium]